MKKQARKISPFLFWAPRILSILFIMFITLFSFDVFDEGLGFWGTLFALFMHNLPGIVLVILLVIAWKHEIVGAIEFGLFGLAYIILTVSATARGLPWYLALSWSMTLALPAFIIGWLWLRNWQIKKKPQKKAKKRK